MHICIFVCFPGGASGKKQKPKTRLPMWETWETHFRSLGQEDPLEEDMVIHSSWRIYYLPGDFHGQRSLEVHSPWGCEGSDTTRHTCTLVFFNSVCLFMGTWTSVCFYCVFLSVCKIPGLDFSIWPAWFRSLYLFIYPSVIGKWVFLYEKCKR